EPAESAEETTAQDAFEDVTVRTRTANVIGLGLIGGSVALGLRQRGWRVVGDDAREATTQRALDSGAIEAVGLDPEAEITFVAVPALAVVDQVKRALSETNGPVTDVG